MALRKYNYHFGDIVGDNGVIYLGELEPERSVSSSSGKGHTYRRCSFLCPDCQRPFEAREENVRRNKTRRCSVCGHKIGKEKLKKEYQSYQQIGVNKDVFFVKEITPTHKYGTQTIRRGVFYNTHTKRFFESDIRNVVTGSCNGYGGSLGERFIEQTLDDLNIEYEREKRFDDLVGEKQFQLRFDFYLPLYNCCIEYDGEQHFKAFGWYNEDDLAKRQLYDEKKNLFCLERKIGIIRIPFTCLKQINSVFIKRLLSEITTEEVLYAQNV